MKRHFSISAPIMALCILSTIACSSDKEPETVNLGVETSKYNALVDKFNNQVEDYNSLISQNLDSDTLLLKTAELIKMLDNEIKSLRLQAKHIRSKTLLYRSAEELKNDMAELDRKVQAAIVKVDEIEKQISIKNIKQITENSEVIVKDEHEAAYNLRVKRAGESMQTLNGIRDIILAQYNDTLDFLRANEDEMSIVASESDINPSVEGSILEEDASPVVTSLQEGGRIVGIARDSVSGSPVEDAFVGFKRKAESTDYFFETRTDVNGQYQSPFLLSGSYYIDIEKTGLIKINNQQIEIRRGQESTENLSLSQPLDEGVYRVTLSWTASKRGAVKDVDSYLKIPGVSTPLNYQRKRLNYHGAFLDRDDTDWVGPETTTINDLKRGTYVYYINNFSSRGDRQALGKSEARVKLYKGNQLLKSFTVPEGNGLDYELFKIVDGEVIETGRYK